MAAFVAHVTEQGGASGAEAEDGVFHHGLEGAEGFDPILHVALVVVLVMGSSVFRFIPRRAMVRVLLSVGLIPGFRNPRPISIADRLWLPLFVPLELWYPIYTRSPKMMQVDRSYNEREVTLAIGEVVEISLAENPTTGFRWGLRVGPEPTCSLVKSWFEPAVGAPGKGGTRRWQFQAERSGTGEIKLEYRRPWELETPPGQMFKLSVHVRRQSATPDSTTQSGSSRNHPPDSSPSNTHRASCNSL